MKLKTVTVEFDYVIVVNDGEDSEKVARDFVREAARDLSQSDFSVVVTDYTPNSVCGWDDGCIPYNADDNKTTGEYLKCS